MILSDRETFMYRILCFTLMTTFFLSCSSHTKGPINTGLQPTKGLDYNSGSMEHGWAELPKTPESKTFVTNAEAVQRGKLLYQHHCVKCHGVKGQGDGELAETLNIKPSDLRHVNPKIPHTYLTFRINEGKGSMPEWKNILTPKQTWELTQYILEFSK